MNEIHENIDRVFREKLFNHDAQPPEMVWKRIERDLSTGKKAAIPLILKIAAAILILAGASTLVWKNVSSEKYPVAVNKKVETEASTANHKENITKATNRNIVAPNKNRTSPIFDKHNKTIRKTDGAQIITAETITNNKNPEPISNKDGLAFITPTQEPVSQPDTEQANLNPPAPEDTRVALDPKTKPQVPEIHNIEDIRKDLIADLGNDEETAKKKNLKWSVGGQAGTQYNYKNANIDFNTNNVLNNSEILETSIVAYAGGIDFEIEPVNRFSVKSGVYYSRSGYTTSNPLWRNKTSDVLKNNTIEDIDIRGVDTDYGTDRKGELSYNLGLNQAYSEHDIKTYETEYSYNFVEVPLIIKYRIIDRKLGFNVMGGIWTNFNVNQTRQSKTSESQLTDADNANSVNYSSSIGLGIDYPITKNMLFNLEPVFRYYLSSIYSNPGINLQPYSFGIMTGVRYSF